MQLTRLHQPDLHFELGGLKILVVVKRGENTSPVVIKNDDDAEYTSAKTMPSYPLRVSLSH